MNFPYDPVCQSRFPPTHGQVAPPPPRTVECLALLPAVYIGTHSPLVRFYRWDLPFFPSSTIMSPPPGCRPWLALMFSSAVLPFLLVASFVVSVSAQSSSSSVPTTTAVSPNVTVIRETSSFTATTLSSSGTQTLALVTVLPTVYNVTLTIATTPTSSINASAPTSSSSASATVLATKIDPAFGVLGTVLILTGLPSAFLGHKNRWSAHLPLIYAHR